MRLFFQNVFDQYVQQEKNHDQRQRPDENGASVQPFFVQIFAQKNPNRNTADKLECQAAVFLQKIFVVGSFFLHAKMQKYRLKS